MCVCVSGRVIQFEFYFNLKYPLTCYISWRAQHGSKLNWNLPHHMEERTVMQQQMWWLQQSSCCRLHWFYTHLTPLPKEAKFQRQKLQLDLFPSPKVGGSHICSSFNSHGNLSEWDRWLRIYHKIRAGWVEVLFVGAVHFEVIICKRCVWAAYEVFLWMHLKHQLRLPI